MVIIVDRFNKKIFVFNGFTMDGGITVGVLECVRWVLLALVPSRAHHLLRFIWALVAT